MMCLSSLPDLLFPSAFTSTNAGESESMTASQSEQRNEINRTKRNEIRIKIILKQHFNRCSDNCLQRAMMQSDLTGRWSQ
jgi:hypothetical protein